MRDSKHHVRGCRVEMLEGRVLMAFAGQVVGYLPDYEVGNYNNIDFGKLTHINYFAISANGNGALASQSEAGYGFSQLQSVVSRAHAAGVTVSITVDWSTPYQTIASSPSASANFTNNLIAFCNTYNLDGIDLDYEPGTLSTSQKNAFGGLLATMHAQTSAHDLVLSAALQVSQHVVPQANIDDLDVYYIMDYDLTSYSSAPYDLSISYLNGWANYGVPKSKLVMGVPFYGRSGSSWSNTQTRTYSSILNDYVSAYGNYPPNNADSLTINGTTWGFNSVATMQQKAQYVLANGYGGMVIWEVGQDHFGSRSAYDSYSLLPAIYNALNLPWMTASQNSSYTYDGSTLTINSGSVLFTGDASSTNPDLNVVVNNSAQLIVGAAQNLGALDIAGGSVSLSGTGLTTTLSGGFQINSAGSLNIGSNVLLLPDSAQNIAQVISAVSSGYNHGGWNGAGISSTLAASTPGHAVSVGYFINGSQVIVRATWTGDANCDGVINADDYALILEGKQGHGTIWSAGNFNYDTKVNSDDWMIFILGVSNAAGRNFSAAAPLAAPVNPLLGPAATGLLD